MMKCPDCNTTLIEEKESYSFIRVFDRGIEAAKKEKREQVEWLKQNDVKMHEVWSEMHKEGFPEKDMKHIDVGVIAGIVCRLQDKKIDEAFPDIKPKKKGKAKTVSFNLSLFEEHKPKKQGEVQGDEKKIVLISKRDFVKEPNTFTGVTIKAQKVLYNAKDLDVLALTVSGSKVLNIEILVEEVFLRIMRKGI